MRFLILLLLAQDLSGNAGTSLERTAPVQAYDEGIRQGRVYGVDCRGAGVTCQRDGGYLFMTIPGGGSAGKVAEAYMADASITSQIAGSAYSADASYYSTQFISNPSDCGANQYATTIAANGNLTCAQVSYSQVTGTPTIYNQTIEDEATPLTQRTNINFTGAGVTCADTGGKTVCTISGGGSGSANVVEQSISLSGGSGFFSQAVTGQAWVTATSKVVCSPFGTVADGLTPQAVSIANLNVSISDLSAGVGFNINIYSPYGLDGTVRIHCTGS